MRTFSSLSSLALLLLATMMPQQSHGLAAVANLNDQTIWITNFARTYLCNGMLPDNACSMLQGITLNEMEGQVVAGTTPEQTISTEGGTNEVANTLSGGAAANTEAGGGPLGLGIIGDVAERFVDAVQTAQANNDVNRNKEPGNRKNLRVR